MMTRAIYRSLLRLHPPSFRRQFSAEMLWIFDEASASEGALALLLDLMLSVARQWLMRSGAWKIALALIGASFQMMAGGLAFFFRSLKDPHRVPRTDGPAPVSVTDLIQVTAVALGLVFVMLLALVFWVNGLNQRRLTDGRTQRWRIKA
jgi:hypothetical protein